MKPWTVHDFFDIQNGVPEYGLIAPLKTFTCNRCGYNFYMDVSGKEDADRAEQKMLQHIAMFHREGLGREPLEFAVGVPDKECAK